MPFPTLPTPLTPLFRNEQPHHQALDDASFSAMAEIQDAPSRSTTAASATEPKSAVRKEAPRKFRNKFVPFFEKKHKIKENKKRLAAAHKKEEALAKAVSQGTKAGSETASSSNTASTSPPTILSSPKTTTSSPSVTSDAKTDIAVTAPVSSSYLDQLIEFERAEKKRLKDIQAKKEKPALIETFPKEQTAEIKQLIKAGPGWIPRLPIEPHGGVEYWKFHEFHTEAATVVLSLGESINKSLWGTYVPQLAYNSGMLSNALVAFDALLMNRPKNDPNLAALASEKFLQAVREMTQAIQYVSSMNFMEIYVTSYVVACFAITEPNVAPIISQDNSQPEMFRIARGMFNPDLKVLNEKYQPPSHFLLPHQLSKPPDLKDLDMEVLNSTEVSFFKLLWDQLDSMEAGSKSISILCGDGDSDLQWETMETMETRIDIQQLKEPGIHEVIQKTYEPVFGRSTLKNYQLFGMDNDSSSPEMVSEVGSSPEEFVGFSPGGVQSSPGYFLSPAKSVSPVLSSTIMQQQRSGLTIPHASPNTTSTLAHLTGMNLNGLNSTLINNSTHDSIDFIERLDNSEADPMDGIENLENVDNVSNVSYTSNISNFARLNNLNITGNGFKALDASTGVDAVLENGGTAIDPADDPKNLFVLLPGELEAYRRTVLYMMHITYDSVKSNRSTILMFSFNTISDEFTYFLKKSRPMALVITAYIMSIFQFKDRYLGDNGTYRRRMQELESLTPEAWHPAFYWPKQILEQHHLHGSLVQLMKQLNLQD